MSIFDQPNNTENFTQVHPVERALGIYRNGYHPLWLRRGTKIPGHNGWLDNPPTEESIRRDFKRPGNIGLIQGIVAPDKTSLVTIDIDIDDASLIGYVERLIAADCIKKRAKKGISFILRGINIESQTLHDYREGKKRPACDILSKGKQTVIPPSIHPDTELPYQWWGRLTPSNTPYSKLPLIDESAIKELRAFLKDANNRIAQLNEMTWKGVGGGGDTHDICHSAVARMVSDEWTDEQIHARIRRAKREACERAGETYHWPQETKTCQEWIDSAREKGFGKKKTKAKPSHGELANIVIEQHGTVIRLDKNSGEWCVYNGQYWEQNATEELKTKIRLCLEDNQVYKSVIDGVEGVMRTYPELGVKNDIWDSDRHYLNCPDGTYNLRNRERFDHDPAHLITKMTRVSPRFDYENTRWVRAIRTWFGNDPAEIEYIQTVFGLFLTGETKDECVAMWIGKSGAGKSKMTDIVKNVMGDYAQVALETAFQDVRYHPHSEEIARMRGKRLVIINEVEGYLNLRRVKSIASGEATSANFKFKDSFEFTPQAKIWFVGNEAPPTKSSGRELKRRYHVYDFIRQIETQDMDLNLGETLRNEAEYVLGWMIDGAVKYYKNGLHRSAHVIESTNRYFSDADIIEQWIEERCIVDPSAVTPVADLFGDFNPWADDAAIKAKPDKGRFSQRLKAKGYALNRRTLVTGKQPVRVIAGLRLREIDELACGNVIRIGDKF